jgi:hypothetical protein
MNNFHLELAIKMKNSKKTLDGKLEIFIKTNCSPPLLKFIHPSSFMK